MGYPGKSNKRKLASQILIFALLGWPSADLAVVVYFARSLTLART